MADAPQSGAEPRPLLGVAPQVGTAAAMPTTLRIAVTNAAPAPRVLSVAVVGLDAAWTEGPQRTEVLAPGASAVVEIRLTPPLGTLPANYPMVVAAQPLDPATGRPTSTLTGTAESVLVVNPRSQLAVDLKPRLVSVIGSRRFAVELRNTGAAPATVQLQLKSTTHVSFTLQRDKVKVGPGETVSVRGRARVKRPTLFGPRSVHSFTLSARGTEAVRHVDGQVAQRSLIGPSGIKVACLLLALAVWAGAAVVFIPALAERVRTASEESAAAEGPGGEAAAEAEKAGSGEDDAGSGESGGDAEPGAQKDAKGLQLSGTVAGERPDGVSVRLEQTSLVNEQAQGGRGVGVPDSVLDGTGMRLASAFLRSAPERAFRDRNAVTAADGSWAFPEVPTPGYYLVSFSKPGYQTQRFVVDSSTAAAAEPLEVDLQAGEGSLSGRITGPNGKPEGGASITITDGTNTAVTNSNSEGDVGAWSIEGLSTPSTYVVTATKHGMSSEARVVPLAAGASATASLDLVAGVATLTGKVESDGLSGTNTGVGGVTITVSDGKGDVRTATTLTQRPRGTYAMPSLPAPGRYAVTASGAGFQSQTRELVLRRGQARATLPFTLTSSTARLSGRVLATNAAGVMVPRPNAGLTLSNAEHTYKTMSTDGASGSATGRGSGGYEFAGVLPGSYVLSARYFGKKTVHQNVEIRTGDSKPWVIRLRDDGSDGLTATSTIEGSVLDINTQLPLPDTTCLPDDPCLTATVRQPKVPETTPATYDTYTTKFSPGANYLLPDPETNPGAFLRPGLHTVTVSAPGYEVGTVEVELGVNTAAIAPLAQLYPAPVIEGTVTSPFSGTHPVSCVWVVPGKKVIGDLSSLGDCAAAQPTPCAESVQRITEATVDAGAWCALSDPETGDYSVQVPTTGDYTLWVRPESAEYLDTAPEHVTLERGQVLPRDISVRRYGVLNLTVLRPGPGDALVPVSEEVLTISHPRAVSGEIKTNTAGRVTITGLFPGTTYTVEGNYQVQGADGETLATMSGALSRTVAIDEVATARLRLINPLPGLMGRVTTSLDDLDPATTDDSLPGARVELEIATTYVGDDLGESVVHRTIDMTSDELGCFAVRSAEVPTRVAPCVSSTLKDKIWGAASIVDQEIATNRVKVLGIEADGYDPLPADQTTDVEFSTAGVTSFRLDPTPIPFGATIGTNPEVSSHGAALDWDDVQLEVLDQPEATGPIELDVVESEDDPGIGTLSWTDPKLDTPGTVLPGSYRIEVSGLDDYDDATAYLDCPVGGAEDGSGCRWRGPADGVLKLQERGRLVVDLVGATYPLAGGGTVPLGAGLRISLTTGTGGTAAVATTDGNGRALFTRISPDTYRAADEDYLLAVTADGYAPGDTSRGTLAVRCPVSGGSAPSTIVITAGVDTTCTLVLTDKLGSIEGTLKGLMAPDGTDPADLDKVFRDEEPNYEHLGNVEVTLRKCTTTACTALEPVNQFRPRTRRTALTTGDPRTGGDFTFAATADEAGLAAGTYLLSVAPSAMPAGYAAPATSPFGTSVTIAPGQDREDVDVPLYATRVTLEVSIVDDTGTPVTGATVLLHRRDFDSPGQVATDTAPTTSSGGTYVFANLVPGWATVRIDAPGLTSYGERVRVLTSRAGLTQSVTMAVQRPRGAATGQITTDAGGSTTAALPGARVELTCADAGGPDASFCPTSGPALDLDREPLSLLTDSEGRFTFTNVPIGTYDVSYSKRGYGPSAPTQVTVVASDPTAPVPVPITTSPLAGNGRRVSVVLTSTHADPTSLLVATTVTVTGVRGTPGSHTTAVTRDPDGTYGVTFDTLRWGCYDVEIDTPDAWRGTVSGPTGSPQQDDLDCDGADLVVPDEPGPDIDLGYGLSSGRLRWALNTAVKPAGHARPTVVLHVEQQDGSYETSVTITDPLVLSGSLFVPAGTYDITASVPSGDVGYWTIADPAPVPVPDGGDAPVRTVDLEEVFFTVTVTVPSLEDGDEALIRYSAGAGQSGTAPPDNSTPTVNGIAQLTLPRGNWQIQGSWLGGPGATVINVTRVGPWSVVINPFAPSTAGRPPSTGTPAPAPPASDEPTPSPTPGGAPVVGGATP